MFAGCRGPTIARLLADDLGIRGDREIDGVHIAVHHGNVRLIEARLRKLSPCMVIVGTVWPSHRREEMGSMACRDHRIGRSHW